MQREYLTTLEELRSHLSDLDGDLYVQISLESDTLGSTPYLQVITRRGKVVQEFGFTGSDLGGGPKELKSRPKRRNI